MVSLLCLFAGEYSAAKIPHLGPNVRLIVPRAASGKWARNTLARPPVMRALGALDRLTKAKGPRPLPAYLPAGDAGRSPEARGSREGAP